MPRSPWLLVSVSAGALALASFAVTGCGAPQCAPAPVVATPAPAAPPVATVAPAAPVAPETHTTSAEDMAAVAATLERFHGAAAAADEEGYFALFAEGGVFMGTDAKERWTVPQFRAYAHPRFAVGKAWSFRSVYREITVRGNTAWFDESLDTPNLGPSRGSGVLVRDATGGWKVAQYNLSVPIPNERFADVKKVIEGAPAGQPTAPPQLKRPPTSAPSPPAGRTDPTVCVTARAARSRNSPAAAGLEAQCRAMGGTP